MLIKNSLIAAAAIAASFVAFQPQAEAGTKVGIYIGNGQSHQGKAHKSQRHNKRRFKGHRKNRRRHISQPFYGVYYSPYPQRPYVRHATYYQWPAWRVRRSLRARGYHNFSRLHYRKGYWLVKANKHGRRFKIRLSAYNGSIVGRHRLY